MTSILNDPVFVTLQIRMTDLKALGIGTTIFQNNEKNSNCEDKIGHFIGFLDKICNIIFTK